MNTDTRVKYKRVKGAIHGEGNSNTLIKVLNGDTERIVDSQELEFDRELCKQIFRTIKEVRFKHPSKVLREDRIDKIIDYCIEQKKQREEQNNG